MGNGGFHMMRACVGALALFGVLCYSALVPGHLVSQASALVSHDEAMLVVEMSCHSETAVLPSKNPDPSEPAKPAKKCPFCKGYASFHTALLEIDHYDLVDVRQMRVLAALLNETPVSQFARSLNNRGPPILL